MSLFLENSEVSQSDINIFLSYISMLHTKVNGKSLDQCKQIQYFLKRLPNFCQDKPEPVNDSGFQDMESDDSKDNSIGSKFITPEKTPASEKLNVKKDFLEKNKIITNPKNFLHCRTCQFEFADMQAMLSHITSHVNTKIGWVGCKACALLIYVKDDFSHSRAKEVLELHLVSQVHLVILWNNLQPRSCRSCRFGSWLCL